jgi:hypothetical protein
MADKRGSGAVADQAVIFDRKIALKGVNRRKSCHIVPFSQLIAIHGRNQSNLRLCSRHLALLFDPLELSPLLFELRLTLIDPASRLFLLLRHAAHPNGFSLRSSSVRFLAVA